jgi:hypothetical protein
VSNQDIDGKLPPDATPGQAAPATGPETLEQQLAKEREARALMRDRLRNTEALAAESHALRARMAQELEKVTADRDRLRSGNANAAAGPAPAVGRPAEPLFTPTMAAPPITSRASDAPLKPPSSTSRKGPWLSLAMLGVVAAVVGAVAWYTGSLSGDKAVQTAVAPATAAPVVAAKDSTASSAAPPVTTPPPAASTTVASVSPSSGVVALPPLPPETQLAAAPTAAGPATAPAPAAMPPGLRKALDGEGITAQVDVDAATGRVMVADPQADAALRERTEMVIRAVYAGAGLPEPQIEHRWMSPMHGTRATPAAAETPEPKSEPSAASVSGSAAAAYAARHVASEHHKKTADVSVAEAEELRPVLPSGRITASCMDGLAGKATGRRAAMTACMKHGCTSSAASHNSEECRAYDKAYPFASSPG